jgi:hypothetical protein
VVELASLIEWPHDEVAIALKPRRLNERSGWSAEHWLDRSLGEELLGEATSGCARQHEPGAVSPKET